MLAPLVGECEHFRARSCRSSVVGGRGSLSAGSAPCPEINYSACDHERGNKDGLCKEHVVDSGSLGKGYGHQHWDQRKGTPTAAVQSHRIALYRRQPSIGGRYTCIAPNQRVADSRRFINARPEVARRHRTTIG